MIKYTAVAAFAIATLLAGNLAQAAAPRIEARQARQDVRIERGYAGGQLTRCEAARLDHRADRIDTRERIYRHSGGLQPRERADLNRRLNSLSGDIREQRRDGNGCW